MQVANRIRETAGTVVDDRPAQTPGGRSIEQISFTGRVTICNQAVRSEIREGRAIIIVDFPEEGIC